MATLEELIAGLQPSEDDRRQAQMLGMLGIFGNLIGARRGTTMDSLRSGILAGTQMQQDAIDRTRKQRVGDLQGRALAAEVLGKEQAFNDAQAMRAAQQASTIPGLPEMGPPTADGRMQGATPPSFDWEGFQGRIAGINPQMALAIDPKVEQLGVRRVLSQMATAPGQASGMAPGVLAQSPGMSLARGQALKMKQTADVLRAAGYTQQADAYAEKAAKLDPEMKEDKTYQIGDQTVVVRSYKDGNWEILPFQPEASDLHFQELGDYVQGFDKKTGQPKGPKIPKGVPPGDWAKIVQDYYQYLASHGQPQFVDGQWVYPPAMNVPFPSSSIIGKPVGAPGVGAPIPGMPGAAPSAPVPQGPPAPPQAPQTAPMGVAPSPPAISAPGPVPAAPGAPAAGARPGPGGGAVPVPGYRRPLDAAALQLQRQNNVTLSSIDTAIKLAEANPNAFGLKNLAPDAIIQRTDPAGVNVRAMVAGIGGQKYHDLSGAAISVSEASRLAPYIPNVKDDPRAVVIKLKNLRREIALMQQELQPGVSIYDVANRPPSFDPNVDPDVEAIDAARKAMRGGK